MHLSSDSEPLVPQRRPAVPPQLSVF